MRNLNLPLVARRESLKTHLFSSLSSLPRLTRIRRLDFRRLYHTLSSTSSRHCVNHPLFQPRWCLRSLRTSNLISMHRILWGHRTRAKTTPHSCSCRSNCYSFRCSRCVNSSFRCTTWARSPASRFHLRMCRHFSGILLSCLFYPRSSRRSHLHFQLPQRNHSLAASALVHCPVTASALLRQLPPVCRAGSPHRRREDLSCQPRPATRAGRAAECMIRTLSQM
mmetsp:Transcript_46423/g.106443  ORF Transcript_46423/g.106443 Transcript_46423/m.106443 type:complete len:223 (-) Transcript_46423:1679-2347(-)